jgi:hypothetical protein
MLDTTANNRDLRVFLSRPSPPFVYGFDLTQQIPPSINVSKNTKTLEQRLVMGPLKGRMVLYTQLF